MIQRWTPAVLQVTRHPSIQLVIPKVNLFDFSGPYSSSSPCSLGQEFAVRHRQVPQVPKDPKHQAKEDDDRSGQD